LAKRGARPALTRSRRNSPNIVIKMPLTVAKASSCSPRPFPWSQASEQRLQLDEVFYTQPGPPGTDHNDGIRRYEACPTRRHHASVAVDQQVRAVVSPRLLTIEKFELFP